MFVMSALKIRTYRIIMHSTFHVALCTLIVQYAIIPAMYYYAVKTSSKL